MTDSLRDRVIAMADSFYDCQPNRHEIALAAAALAVAHEREACAQVCLQGDEAEPANTWETGFKAAMRSCAAAIRTRKEEL